jgi:hypothetical protein
MERGRPFTQDEDQQDQASNYNRSWLFSLDTGVIARSDARVVEDHLSPRGSGEMVRDYARMDNEDERVKDNISHRHFILVLKAAWRILNAGVEFNS